LPAELQTQTFDQYGDISLAGVGMSLGADNGSQWQQVKAGEATTDATQAERSVNAVLQLQLFCQVRKSQSSKDLCLRGHISSKEVLTSSCLLHHLQHPTLDFGTVAVGSRKTLYLKAENSALLNQVCSMLLAAQHMRLTCCS
jgi:hypothetical protein